MTSYCGLPVFNLRDVLREIDAPHSTSFENISSKWQCVIAPRIPLSRNNINNDICRTNYTAIKYLDAGVAIQWPALPHLRTSVKTKKIISEVTTTSTSANTTYKEEHTDNDELVKSSVRQSDVCSLAASNNYKEEAVKVNEEKRERGAFSNDNQAVAKWREYNNTFCSMSNGWVDAPFKRPQIAMRTGWDAPGESITTSRYHTLVSSFADVFNSSLRSHEVALPTQHEPCISSTKMNMKAFSLTTTTTTTISTTETTVTLKEECANNSCQLTKKCNTWDLYRSDNHLSNIVEMQYFYRNDCREDDVQLPRFADNFNWPQVLHDTSAKLSFVGESSVIASQRGAIRRWHINDDGEFTMQAVLYAAYDKAKFEANTISSSDDNNVHKNSIESKCCKYTMPTVNIQNIDETSVELAANCNEIHDINDKCNITADKMYEIKESKREKLLEEEEKQEEEEQSSLLTEEAKERSCEIRSFLYEENDYQDATSVPARLVICSAKYSYDWFIHDDESNVESVHASLDLLYTPDEALPSDKELLPILTVAVIMSNSPYALLLPPNLPHMSITLNDSIIIEQSRISELWLDDIAYFMHRCQHWVGQPVMYEYLASNLQDDHFVGGELIPKLIYFFDNVDKLLAGEVKQNYNMITTNSIYTDSDDDNSITLSCKTGSNVSDIIFTEYCALVRKRIVMSLLAIAHNEDYFELNASSRASLMLLLHSKNDDKNNRSEIAVIAASSMWTHWNDRGKQGTNRINGTSTSVETFLCEEYWNTEKWWPKPGCVMRIPVRITSSCNSHMYLPIIYVRHRPVFGTEKCSIEETVHEYFEMKELADKPESLFKYLASRKQHHDVLLDDLF